MEGKNKYTNLLIVFSICFSIITNNFWRKSGDKINPFVWDVANYYSYLPAVFDYKDGFKDKRIPGIDFLQLDKNNIRIPKVTYGVAFFYLPWHALGHQIALHTDYAVDGKSAPYIDCIYWGAVIYSILSLFILRSVLKNYFSDIIVAIALTITYFGTNWFYYSHGENLMPHGFLFFLYSFFLYFTHKWYIKQNFWYAIGIGLSSGFISLIRPIDIVVVFIFIFWPYQKNSKFIERVNFYKQNISHLAVIIISAFIVWLPQLIFWKYRTGNYFYDSYGSGEKFYFSDPQIINVLFSYRKGWLLYTPLASLFLLGFFFMKDEVKHFRIGFFIAITLTFYFVCTWWDWFFGGCFSHRAFIQHYAYLIFPLCCFLKYIFETNNYLIRKYKLKLFTTIIIFFGIFLNLIQSFQYASGLLHHNAMSKGCYWNAFCKANFTQSDHDASWLLRSEPNYETLQDGTNRDQ